MDTTGNAPRENRTEHVQIRELGTVGGNSRPAAGYFAPESDDAGQLSAPEPVPVRKPYRAAWLLTALLLGVGLLGIGGAFESAMQTSYSAAAYSPSGDLIGREVPPLTTQLRNLGQSAPMFLAVGLMSASALLIVQGSQRSRDPAVAAG